jgi:hypothetical protein
VLATNGFRNRVLVPLSLFDLLGLAALCFGLGRIVAHRCDDVDGVLQHRGTHSQVATHNAERCTTDQVIRAASFTDEER